MTKSKQEQKENEGDGLTAFYNDLLHNEFDKETDRGAVILVASLFDIQLESYLRTYLVPDSSSTDQLFEGATAPLSTFSAKILMSYRLGLISKNFARDLNLIRKVRNEFAHNIHGCSFEHSSVKSRVHELARSSNVCTKYSRVRKGLPMGTRGDFLMCCSWMLWSLSEDCQIIQSISECEPEFGYQLFDDLESEKEDEVEN